MRSAGLVAVALAAALSLPACTAVGFFIGSMVDKDKPSVAEPVHRADLETLDVGESIEVSLWDGRMLSGRYRGLQWVKPDEYATRYEAARRDLAPDTLPALGNGAHLSVASGKTGSGAYLGLGPSFVSFREEKAKKASAVSLDRVNTLSDGSGRSISGKRLRDLVDQRRVPTLNLLALEQAGTEVVLDVGEVASVRRLVRPHGGRTTGALVGLAADIAIVVAVAASMNSGWGDSTPSSTYTSCPLFDSYDGHEWVLDAEPLGGAFYAGAERTDVARLDRLSEVGGEYRLRLRNDQQEIDHVDAVALRVVDHAPGTEVVPDAAGGLHAVRSLLAPAAGRVIPSSAPDRRDPNVVRLVATADGDGWVSDVWGRDPSVADHLRDGVELTYRVPPGTRSALLVTRSGATAFAPRVLRDVLELQGRDLGSFYARLGRDSSARAAFEEARTREVLPTIRVWDGDGWKPAGVLRDLPSLVRRDQATPLELPAGTEGTLKVRIDGPPGLWALDRAAVSFDARPVRDDVRVPLSGAVAEDGTDRAGLLRDVDGRRHSLLPHRGSATLTFAAPPPRPGLTRTVLVEATGYYSVLVAADGEPQREAFRRLVDEPGGVARFALERLRQRRTPAHVTRVSPDESAGPVR